MQANQSFTASGKQSRFGARTAHLQIRPKTYRPLLGRGQCVRSTIASESRALEVGRSQSSSVNGRSEGLLHDARNLVGTIGLYCDLLSMPGVLKPEHRQYPEELRLLGARSKSMIELLMQSMFALEEKAGLPVAALGRDGADRPEPVEIKEGGVGAGQGEAVRPVSLRSIVERCSGLLSHVASGRRVEISYGPAAAAPVSVSEEAVERILVNLVRNAAAAMSDRALPGESANSEDQISRDAIRIMVGAARNRVGEHRPWPYQRVRLVVEDAGCGMSPQRLERLLSATDARLRTGHGIGFGVVLDLVAASKGEIQVMSEPKTGTRVQIEWPVVAMLETEKETVSLPQKSASSGRLATSMKFGAASRRLRILQNMGMAVAH